MSEWLKFSVAYWHTMDQRLTDPFGEGTAIRPWDIAGDANTMTAALVGLIPTELERVFRKICAIY